MKEEKGKSTRRRRCCDRNLSLLSQPCHVTNRRCQHCDKLRAYFTANKPTLAEFPKWVILSAMKGHLQSRFVLAIQMPSLEHIILSSLTVFVNM